MDLIELDVRGMIRGDPLGIDELADRIRLELLRGPHPLSRLGPIAEVVDLELDVVAVGVGVVVGERHAVIDAERRLDPGLLQTQIAGVELVEPGVLEGRVMEAGAGLLLGIVGEAGEREQGDPVIRGVIAEPGADVVLKVDLGADEDRVEIDHLLETGRLQVEVVELGMDHCRRVGHVQRSLIRGRVVR